MHKKTVLLLFCLLFAGCRGRENHAACAKQRHAAELLFEKKVQCGQFLRGIDGSATGPPVKDWDKDAGAPLNPLVFYNSRLNTCVLITAQILHEHTYFEVEDVLTGQSLEWRDVPSADRNEVRAEIESEKELVEKYSK